MTAVDGFAWVDMAWGPAVWFPPLGAVADHFFTTRKLRLRGESEADDWRLVAEAIGVPPGRLLRLTQVHGSDVVVFRAGDLPPGIGSGGPGEAGADGERWPEADIAVTDDPSVALAVQVADCVPLLLADRRTGAVAAVHAGWRGTAAGAAPAAVAALVREFGSIPGDLVAAQGPSIGPCCYEVGGELTDAFRGSPCRSDADHWFTRGGDGRLRLDLWAANRDQLLACGLSADSIHQAGLCTASREDLFASYRRDGPGTGRIAAVIRSRGRLPLA